MAKQSTDLPEKWLDFSPIGNIVEGTNIIVCKTPLKTELLTNVPQDSEHQFKPSSLPEHLEKINKTVGLVIDLTNTSRYYHPLEIKDIKSDYYKLPVIGQAIPDECFVHQFIKVIDNFNAFVKEGGDPAAIIDEAIAAEAEEKAAAEKAKEEAEAAAAAAAAKVEEGGAAGAEGAEAAAEGTEEQAAEETEEAKPDEEMAEEKAEDGDEKSEENGEESKKNKEELSFFSTFINQPDVSIAVCKTLTPSESDDYQAEMNESEKVIVVHCTHGVNRSGYLVARFLIDRLGVDPETAISYFHEARGHEIDRNRYLRVLRDDSVREMARSNAQFTYLADRTNYQRYYAGQRFKYKKREERQQTKAARGDRKRKLGGGRPNRYTWISGQSGGGNWGGYYNNGYGGYGKRGR